MTKEVFEASKGRLKVVGRAGVGVDNVDLASATDTCPSMFAHFGMRKSISRRLHSVPPFIHLASPVAALVTRLTRLELRVSVIINWEQSSAVASESGLLPLHQSMSGCTRIESAAPRHCKGVGKTQDVLLSQKHQKF